MRCLNDAVLDTSLSQVWVVKFRHTKDRFDRKFVTPSSNHFLSSLELLNRTATSTTSHLSGVSSPRIYLSEFYMQLFSKQNKHLTRMRSALKFKFSTDTFVYLVAIVTWSQNKHITWTFSRTSPIEFYKVSNCTWNFHRMCFSVILLSIRVSSFPDLLARDVESFSELFFKYQDIRFCEATY